MKKIKVFFAVLFCKTVRFLAKLLGRGSSLPGKLTLKLFPGVLGMIKLPEYVIAVTGSNGKTSTVEMIAHTLIKLGCKVSYNKEGSNQIEGVATFILNDCTLSGRLKSDYVVMESDERFARHTFKYIKPKYYVITNLYRDQLTRNGHPEWIYDIIEDGIDDSMTLILNADDPLVSKFGYNRDKVLYFGAERLKSDTVENTSLYNDGKYCPVCKGLMKYEYYHYNHIGSYECTECGFKRPETRWKLTDADLESGSIEINGKYKVGLNFSSIYHCYNTLAAFAVLDIAGADLNKACDIMSSYNMTSGRVINFTIGENRGTLLASKHENSVSYDRSIDVAVSDSENTAVLIIVDAVSRKYFTSETSWLWDIDFEKLNRPGIREVILSGRYCNDLANRFLYTGIPDKRMIVKESIADAVGYIRSNKYDYVYTITCFADKDKFLSLIDGKGTSV